MAVREYIGARYVPIFADPIQWDPTLVYEPLTVVTDQGASYVSRQSVPEGIQLDNTDYWILWADYNAQLQHYINEVNAFDGRIDVLEGKFPIASSDISESAVINITGAYNVCAYGADPTGATDSYQAIMDAAADADGKGNLYFPSGTYAISTELDLTAFDIFNIVGDDCAIIPTHTVSYIIKPFVDTTGDHKAHHHIISGFNFDGKGYAQIGIVTAQQITIKDCGFTNFLDRCIAKDSTTQSGQGLRIFDCDFINDTINTHDYDNAIAIDTVYDWVIENCRIWGFCKGIQTYGGNAMLSNTYFYNREADFETIAIYCANLSEGFHVDNCYFDSMNVCGYNTSGTYTNCLFLAGAASNQNTHDYYLFHVDGTPGYLVFMLIGCVFNWADQATQSRQQIVNNERVSICTDGCITTGYFPQQTVLCNLYKSAVSDDKFRMTGAQFSTASKWYRIAKANKQANVSDGTQWYAAFEVGSRQGGRNTIIQKVSTRNMEGAEVISGYSLRSLFDFGVIQTGNTMEFYAKPVSAFNDELYISDVRGGNYLNALWVDYEETTLNDSDMTSILAHS